MKKFDVLYLINGIWETRPAKSAKESANWIEHIMQVRDAAFMAQLRANGNFSVVNFKPETQEDSKQKFSAWRKSLEPRYWFTADEKAYEVFRRRLVAKEARNFMGNRAAAAAAVFCKGLSAAASMLDVDVDELIELGGKKIFDEIARYNKAIGIVEDQILDKKDLINYIWSITGDRPELVDAVRDLEPELNELKEELKELKAERKVLSSALKELRDGADDDTRALIDARAKVVSKKVRQPKSIVGRQINKVDKPELKSFSIMSFVIGRFISKEIKSLRKTLTEKAKTFMEIQAKNDADLASDDEVKAARHEAYIAFMDLYDAAKKMRDSGTSFEASESDCVINNARQSQLSDVIGVRYGRTTEMMISVEHTMANFVPNSIRYALSDDPNKAQKNIDGLEMILMEVLTRNGLTINFKGENGAVRKQHYRFWNANNSALKVGKCYVLSDEAYSRAKEVGQAGMSDEEFWQVPTNGSDMLKWWSYATTPGCPLMYNGEPLTVNDVLVVDSIETLKEFENVMIIDENGKQIVKPIAKVARTAYDGQMFFLIPIPSQQIRGGMSFKGYGVCCAYEDGTTMIDEIAKREGRTIPEYIRDIDGVMRRWRDYKVICTKDCWKWTGYKISYADYCARMNKLAETYPTANVLYTARIADATEEGKRKLTRQSTQQFMFAGEKAIAELTAKSVSKVNKLRTHDGIIRKMAGLDKPEEERSYFERLIEAAPEMLNNPLMKRYIHDVFNRSVAEAAVRPEVDGIYPYIAEDPVAFFKIVIWGEDPNKDGLGYLNKDQVNIPNADEGKEMYLVRYPNNYLCGMIGRNHNDNIYRCVGNTMILSFDGYYLTRADGDTDGDEMCAIFNKIVIDLMKASIRYLNPPLIVFPHDKLGKNVYETWNDRAAELAKSIVIANKFGPAVGQNSNLATRFMNAASIARMEVGRAINEKNSETLKKARFKLTASLKDAIVAHIAAIIAIDLSKTGKMPEWLQKMLADVEKYASKKMPWNQRFCKDNKQRPWFYEGWDELTAEETNSVVDRIARFVVDATNAYNYEAPTGDGFNVESILPEKTGLYVQGSNGILDAENIRALDSRNYRKENSEGDSEFSLLKDIHDGKTVSFAELIRFLWRNQASLVYKLQKGGEDNLDNARQTLAYYAYVRDLMINFGSVGGNKTFMSKPADIQRKSNVYKAVKMAFSQTNKIGENAITEEERESAKASFMIFVVRVFAKDLYEAVCDRKQIVDRWTEPETCIVDECDYAEVGDDSMCFSVYDDVNEPIVMW